MADKKITELPSVSSPSGTDVLPIVDVSASLTGKITKDDLLAGHTHVFSDVTGTLPTTQGGTGLTSLGTTGQIIKVNSGATALEYVDDTTADITSVVAGSGLTGGASSGDATLNVIGGDGITASADEVEVTVDGSTLELSASDGTGSVRVKDGGISYAKIQDVSATDRLLGRDTAGAGDVEEITPAAVRTMLNVADGATANDTDANLKARANHTGTQAASTISDFDTEVANNSAVTANTAKTGITSGQASAITANTAKTGITSGQASAITANTAKTGITSGQASAITANTAKTGITSGQASAITANTAKTGITSGQASAITANTSKTTNATHTSEVTGATALTIADNVVDEANLKVGGTLTDDYVLTADTGATGGMKWAASVGSGHDIVEELGSALTTRAKLTFIGELVEAVDNAVDDSTDILINAKTSWLYG